MCVSISTYTYLQVANGTPKGWRNYRTQYLKEQQKKQAVLKTHGCQNYHKEDIHH